MRIVICFGVLGSLAQEGVKVVVSRDRRVVGGFNFQFALQSYVTDCVGNGNIFSVKALKNLFHDAGAQNRSAIFRVFDPEAELQIDAVVAKAGNHSPRRRGGKNSCLTFGDVDQYRQRAVDVTFIADTGFNGCHRCPISEGEVLDVLGDKRFIRDDHLFAGKIAKHGVTSFDLSDFSVKAIDFHGITDFHGVIKQNDETGNIVGGDFLKTKPQTDTDGAAKNTQNG